MAKILIHRRSQTWVHVWAHLSWLPWHALPYL